MKPTPQQYQSYQNIFDYFNKQLFENKLPSVILSFSRKANTRGFFAAQRWENSNGKKEKVTHEIALNPQSLRREPILVLATLVHEMVHLWQQEFGKISRTGYHNRQWAGKMEIIGLMPSTTGDPGGKKVGQSMTHYIIPGGRYEHAFNKMPQNNLLPFMSLEEPEDGAKKKKKRSDKVKFTCPTCDANAWGKSTLNLTCGDCEETMKIT